MVDELKSRIGSGAVLIVADTGGRAAVAAGVTADLTARLSAVDIVKAAAAQLGGTGGGGRADMAQAGGTDASRADAAVKAGEMQYTVLQPVAVFSAEAVKQADSFIKTGATGAATEKQLFDCQLITKDNVAKYTAPFTLSE